MVGLLQRPIARDKDRNFGANAMKRVAAGAHLLTPWLFSLRNAQKIEPNAAWAAVSSSNANIRYSFLLEWSGAPMGEK